MDAGVPLYNIATLEQIVSNSVTLPRMYAFILAIFAAIAVGLAIAVGDTAIGIYGLMAYAVVRQTREIGIRMALGARRGEVLALVLWQSGKLTAVGTLVGLGAAIAATRYLQGLLLGLTPLDPSTFAGVTIAFAATAVVAAYIPARGVPRAWTRPSHSEPSRCMTFMESGGNDRADRGSPPECSASRELVP
jgi:ABC-type antimicrobial peptide transport system permease subunit